MDPNEVLSELRRLTMEVFQGGQKDPTDLALAFASLDMWIAKGGFLPTDWQHEDGPSGTPQ